MKPLFYLTIFLTFNCFSAIEQPKCKFDPYLFHCRNVNESEWVENIEAAESGLLVCTECDINTLPLQQLKLSTRQYLRKIKLHNISNIIQLDEKTFNDCIKLEDIVLMDVTIEELKPEYLKPLRDLEELELINVRTKYKNSESFKYIPHLEELKITESPMETVNFELLQHLAELEKLNLNSNKIKEISPNAFQNNRDLEKIYLYNNLITALQQNIFDNLRKLKVLDLSNNPLIEFDFKHIVNTNLKLRNLFLFDIPCTSLDGKNLTGRKCAVDGNEKKSISAYNKMSNLKHEVFGDKSKCDVLCYSAEHLNSLPENNEYRSVYNKGVVLLEKRD